LKQLRALIRERLRASAAQRRRPAQHRPPGSVDVGEAERRDGRCRKPTRTLLLNASKGTITRSVSAVVGGMGLAGR
ncbi:MAG: hypothetical protein KJ901_25450, partial [Gammaproteobacteria bacterium]|nr:hypothetical protein [Gammaproteobacteria bacterium]